MTTKEFFLLLRNFKDGFTWRIDEDGLIRGQIKNPLGRDFDYCPITAVATLVKGENYCCNTWHACKDLSSSMDDLIDVIMAADNKYGVPEVRTEMMDILFLGDSPGGS